jgi:hypothetical protein
MIDQYKAAIIAVNIGIGASNADWQAFWKDLSIHVPGAAGGLDNEQHPAVWGGDAILGGEMPAYGGVYLGIRASLLV